MYTDIKYVTFDDIEVNFFLNVHMHVYVKTSLFNQCET